MSDQVPEGDPLLLAIIEAVAAGPDVEPLAAKAADIITAATGTDVCLVHVLDDAGASLTLAGATPPLDGAVGAVTLPLGVGVSGWVARHREPVVIVEDKYADPRYVSIPALHGEAYTSMASVPMASTVAGLVGVLNVHTVHRRDFTDDDVARLTVIGTLLAGAMHSARLHRRLAAREHERELFAEQAITAQETERRRLAADIHDGITQRLVSLAYHLDAAGRALPPGADAAREQLEFARGITDECMDEARAAIGGLRPPILDDLGLPGALDSLAREVRGVDVALEVDERRLPEPLEVALYRITQEALQNVVKHADAAHVRIRFAVADETAHLEVVDDGCGIDPAQRPTDRRRGYGMHSMAERAELVGGTLRVDSPGGTRVRVTAPLTTVTTPMTTRPDLSPPT